MLDLAIHIDIDANGMSVIETNRGFELKAPSWPQDCDFQLVAFSPSGKTCEVIWTEELANDIREAITALKNTGALPGQKPAWYCRLARYARGASQ